MSLTENRKSIHPSHFDLVEVLFTNHKGEEKDIRNICAKIEIRESLYLPSLMCEVSIIDAANFFEAFNLIGQEKIRFRFSKHAIYDENPQELDLEFYVTEYPMYARIGESQNQQTYTLRGISKYAYYSKFLKISRSYTSSSTVEIEKILLKDLYHESILINGEDATTHTGVINIQEPLAAIEYLRKSAYDEFGAPFFFYQTLDGQVQLSSLTYLADTELNKKYNNYIYLKGYQQPPTSEAYYKEHQIRILACSSSLQLSKAFQSSKGAFASKSRNLDIATKTYTTSEYNYMDTSSNKIRQTNFEDIGSRQILSEIFSLGPTAERLNELPDAHEEYIATNTGAFPSGINYNVDLVGELSKLNAYKAIMNTIEHNIRLNGDFNLNAGRKIRLIFPKAVDADVYATYNKEDADDQHIDTILSGNYIAASVNHVFDMTTDSNTYTCELKVIKDSLLYNPTQK